MQAEGWDFADDVANEDVFVGADKEEAENEAEEEEKTLEEEIERDRRQKERDGHAVKQVRLFILLQL